ncbi:MAG: Gram-negative bacterial tonB protein [bacterium ADurb.Bin157]|nr:MAG: Gram-negative bacterial tonB protein [bacterium ADurb.Bin157]
MDIRIPETKKAFLSLFSLSAALFLQFFLIIALYETCGSCNEKNSDVLKTVKINLVSVSNENASIEPDSPKILTEPPPQILLEKQLLALPEMPPAILHDMAPPIVPDIPTEVLPKTEIIEPMTQPATAAPLPTARAAADSTAQTPIKAQRSAVLTDESSKYLIKVRTIIEKNKKYPIKARKKQAEGTVSLSFSISKAGRISKLTVLESPDKSLADASTELLKSVKLPKPPATWNETKAVKFEINYRLR